MLTTRAGGGTTVITGSSAATAVLTGAVALILQWGVVEGNRPALYPPKINTLLISGTRTRPGDIYPNPSWGYGILDLNKVFENLRSFDEDLNRNIDKKNNVATFTKKVIVRIPKELYNVYKKNN